MRTTSRRGRGLRVLAPVAALGLLAACGGGGGTSSSGTSGGGGGDDKLDLAAVSADELKGTTIKLSRFFGDCEDTAGTETDVAKATSECETIQILTNAFNAENENGIKVERLGGAQWDTYYDALNSAYAGEGAPDVAVMHGSRLTDYAKRGLVLPLDDHLAATGTEIDDAAEAAREAVSYEDETYGLPFDLHAGLAHLNIDLFKQAGLVDAEGKPKIPTSTEEFLADAETMKAKTGKNYFGAARVKDGLTVHMWRSLVEQQGASVISEDGSKASVDTPEAREALEFVNTVFEKYADGNQTYDAAQSAFLSGETAMLFNGTWAVDQYDREATFDYMVTDFPTLYDQPAIWADSHMWVLPKQKEGDPAKYRAGLEFINYLYDHSGDWAIHTGHLAARTSVLESPEYQQAPQRANYFETGTTNAKTVPAISNWSGAMDAMVASLDSIWFEGKSVDEGLKAADTEVNSVLSK
jgi:multiple sugar transport system substrate-binding protein